jgi:pimeloyl-ACP methyl ester carboxylesterase
MNKYSPAAVSSWLRRYLKIPYKLYAEQAGPADGPTIILLHGIATSSKGWDQLVPQLATKYRCISIDLLGFGESPKPRHAAYSPVEHVASIRRTLRGLKLKKPYIVVGHSLGSLLAARYVRLYPDEVAKFYMLSPPIYVGMTDTQRRKRYAKLRVGSYMRAYSYLRRHKRFTLTGARHVHKILRAKQMMLDDDTWIPFERSLEQCIENQNIIADMRANQTPTKILYGTRDPLIIPSEIRSLTKFAHVTVKKLSVGHMLTDKYTALIAATVLADS